MLQSKAAASRKGSRIQSNDCLCKKMQVFCSGILCSGNMEYLQGWTSLSQWTYSTSLYQLYLGQRIVCEQRYRCGFLGENLHSEATSALILTSFLLLNHITGNIHQRTGKKSFDKFQKN